MNRSRIIMLTLIFCIGILSSCSRRCNGGGWYGKRNLGYVPSQNRIDKTIELTSIDPVEEDCEETAD